MLGSKKRFDWRVGGIILHFDQIIAVNGRLFVFSGFQKLIEILEVVPLDKFPDLAFAVLENQHGLIFCVFLLYVCFVEHLLYQLLCILVRFCHFCQHKANYINARVMVLFSPFINKCTPIGISKLRLLH